MPGPSLRRRGLAGVHAPLGRKARHPPCRVVSAAGWRRCGRRAPGSAGRCPGRRFRAGRLRIVTFGQSSHSGLMKGRRAAALAGEIEGGVGHDLRVPLAGVEGQRAAGADAIDDAGAHAGEAQRADVQLGAVDQLDHARAQAFQRDVLEGDFGAPRSAACTGPCDFVVDTTETGFFGNGCRFVGGKRNGSAHDRRISGLSGRRAFLLVLLSDRRCAVARLIMECAAPCRPWRYRFFIWTQFDIFPYFCCFWIEGSQENGRLGVSPSRGSQSRLSTKTGARGAGFCNRRCG